jgi:4-hydroxybenzoate polyprenyltransferase
MLPEMREEVEAHEDRAAGKRTIPAAIFVAMRPRQWTKNLLLFAGFLFTIDGPNLLARFAKALLGFSIFCMLSGSTYIVNDIVDVESDRHHPKKRFRPIASGELPVPAAITSAIVLPAIALAGAWYLGPKFTFAAICYVALTLSYSFLLKNVVIVDVLILASGFVIRAIAGAWAIPVGISNWLVLCTLLLALFLGIEKRRGQLIAVQAGRQGGRKIILEYSPELLDQMSTIVTSALLMSYALYTIQSESALRHHYLLATIPFVLYGIFRYLYLIHRRGLGESPDEVLIKDKPLMLNILLWGCTTGLIVFLNR